MKPASTSKGQRAPPTIQRKHQDWPILSEILGSPHSANDLREQTEPTGSNPPTPYVTPVRRPELEKAEGAASTEENAEDVLGDRLQSGPHIQAETSEGQQQPSQTNCDAGETSRESARHDADGEVGNDTAEEVVRRAAIDSRKTSSATISDGRVKERISTVVLPDGRVFVTKEKFE